MSSTTGPACGASTTARGVPPATPVDDADHPSSGVDLRQFSVPDLLRMYARILDELLRRKVIRTRNPPVGDYAEWLVAAATGGRLEPNSNRSWDVTTPQGTHLQVKARIVGPETRMTAQYSVFRSWDFDRCVFIRFGQSTYDVDHAVSVPRESIMKVAGYSPHTNGHRVRLGLNLLALDGAKDVTAALRMAAAVDGGP